MTAPHGTKSGTKGWEYALEGVGALWPRGDGEKRVTDRPPVRQRRGYKDSSARLQCSIWNRV